MDGQDAFPSGGGVGCRAEAGGFVYWSSARMGSPTQNHPRPRPRSVSGSSYSLPAPNMWCWNPRNLHLFFKQEKQVGVFWVCSWSLPARPSVPGRWPFCWQPGVATKLRWAKAAINRNHKHVYIGALAFTFNYMFLEVSFFFFLSQCIPFLSANDRLLPALGVGGVVVAAATAVAQDEAPPHLKYSQPPTHQRAL